MNLAITRKSKLLPGKVRLSKTFLHLPCSTTPPFFCESGAEILFNVKRTTNHGSDMLTKKKTT